MNDAIIVNYDPFVRESRVSIMKEGEKETIRICSEIEELSEALVGFAYGSDVYSVKVSGPFAVANEIKRNVQTCEQLLYSTNKITVEGF